MEKFTLTRKEAEIKGKIPEGYKVTEVGVIPEDWEVIKLGNLSTIATGSTPPTSEQSYYGDQFLFVSPYDITEHKFVNDSEKKLSKKGFSISRKFPPHSILFVCIGSTIGKCAIAPIELTTNQQINVILPSEKFSTDYVYYALTLAAPRIRTLAGLQAVPIVNKTQFSETIIPLPPLPEQRAIAEALSDVDKLIESLDKLIAKKKAIKQAAMQQLLTGKVRLPGFQKKKGYKKTEVGVIPEDWEVVNLGELTRLQGGYSFRSKDFSDVGIPVIRISDIQDGTINIAEAICHPPMQLPNEFIIRKGDILIAMSGATTGKVGLYIHSIEAYQNQRVGKFIIKNKNKTSKKFIAHLVNSNLFQIKLNVLLEQGAQPNISGNQIESLVFSVPTNLAEQRAIANILSDMDAEIQALERRREKIRKIKQGMMQVLLTGKIRLV